MRALWFDLRQTSRAMARQPGFIAVACVTLGVGFAAHFTAFGLVDRLLSMPPHIAAADRVHRLHIERADVGGGRFLWFQTPFVAYQDLRAHARAFSAMASYRTSRVSVGTGADARQIAVTFADEQYFPLLGVAARIGRTFGREDNLPPAGNRVLVLSDGYWRSSFGADPSAIGRTVQIGTETFTVIGVAPRGFTGDTPEVVDAWAPLFTGARELPTVWTTSPLYRSVMVLARLAPGVTREAAAGEAAAAYRGSIDGSAAADATARVVLASLSPGRTQQGALTPQARIALWLEGVSILVLLVAIANVVNLLLSRAVERRREMAVRVALGAARSRLLSALAAEALVMATAGAVIGALLTWWSTGALYELLMPGATLALNLPRLALVAVLTTAATATLIAAFASINVRLTGISERLKTGRGGDGFTRARLRQGLLVAQVVMSMLLLVGAGLFIRSIVNVGRLQFGIDPDRVLAVSVPLRAAGFSDAAAEDFYARSIESLRALPGVEAVAASFSTPFSPSQRSEIFVPGFDRLPFAQGDYPTFYTVTPGFFAATGMRMLRGRGFTDADGPGAPRVVIVEEALAAVLWPGQDAIGKCFMVVSADSPCREIVGVATNTRRFVGTPTGALRFYVPMGQRTLTLPPQALLIRTAGDPRARIPDVRQALLGVAANLPYAQVRVLRELAEPETRSWRLGGTLFVVFGAAALVVATAGVYALLSFVVMHRSREIGVRLALGASPAQASRMIVGQSTTWVVLGLVCGLGVALSVVRFVEPLLFETSAYDWRVFGGAAAVLALVGLAASLLPAIRASRVDPTVALRAE